MLNIIIILRIKLRQNEKTTQKIMYFRYKIYIRCILYMQFL